MKKTNFYHILTVLTFSFLAAGLLLYANQLSQQDPSLAAVTARISLPTTLSVVGGQQLKLPVRLDTGGNTVIGVDIDLSFDKTLLEFVDIVSTSKVYPLMLPQVSGNTDKPKIITTANTTGRIKTSLVAATANGEPTPGYSGQLSDPLYELYSNALAVSASRTTNIELVHSPGSTTDSNVTISDTERDALSSTQNTVLTINPVFSSSIVPSPLRSPVQSSAPRTTPSASSNSIPSSSNTITVYASGTIAQNEYPHMRVWMDGSFVSDDIVVNKSTVAATVASYFINYPSVSPHKIRLYFTNDKISNNPHQDRNLRIQKINIQGRDYLTASADVYSVGSCDSSGCGAGFKRNEWIHSGWWTKNPPLLNIGYFEFNI
ncbi:MAG: hypothetical protein KatS3mg087_1008 [Patescibacteria group bacterium]|nr:MAG: hypothetical protein KatS3mg087_1008 [Patescibacteria group bacterium]